MSFLPGDRFSAKSDQSDVPRAIRTSRLLLWIQAVIGLLASAFVGVTTWQIQNLSDAELSKQTKGKLSHEQIPYLAIYGFAAALVVLSLAFIWCAGGLKARRPAARIVAYVAEGLLIPVSVFNMTVYTQMQLACIFILPAMATIVLLSTRPAKDWLASAADG